MGIEDDVRSYIARGYDPQQLIQLGFKKSTVYKVYAEQKPTTSVAGQAMWSAQGISFNRGIDGRYLPQETATIGFTVVNQSPSDMYVFRAGVQPEWLERHLGTGQSEWLTQDGTFLLRPNQGRAFRLRMEVPGDLVLGQYDLRFGIEGQFLTPHAPAFNSAFGPTPCPQWTEPVVFRVQYPLRQSAFVSHSTSNMSLIRQLDNSLDNFGIRCVVAEDIKTPGQDLHEKFYHHIDESSLFLAILTSEAVMSQMVIDEVNYAIRKRKAGIYLVEEGAGINLPVEWASQFSRNWPPEKFVAVVLEAIENIQKQGTTYASSSFTSGAILVGLAAFFIGLAAGKSSKEPKPQGQAR